MKKWCLWLIISVMGIALIVLTGLYMRASSRNEYYEGSFDTLFRSGYGSLCSNLNKTVTDPEALQALDADNLKEAHLCFSTFAYTSYANDETLSQYLNYIVYRLYELSESKELYEELNSSTVSDLNRLSTNMQDTELIFKIYNEMQK